MATVGEVLDRIDRKAPWRSAYQDDPVGLQVGRRSQTVTRALVSLDRSMGAASKAAELSAELLVTHHPLFFRQLARLTDESEEGRLALFLAERSIALISAHTNWDAAHGGVNDVLAEILGLQDVRPFGPSGPAREAKLVVFVPRESTDRVIDALSEAGCGEIGLYRRCAFYSRGTGTFRPLEGSNPAIGQPNAVECVEEDRVEMLVPRARVAAALEALRAHHPYEEPAFDILPLEDRAPWPIGRIGALREPSALGDFARFVDERLQTRCWLWGKPDATVRRIAVVGGAGDDLWRDALTAGAQVLVTGEVRQHHALAASEAGLAMIAAGHYATENPGTMRLREFLGAEFPEVEWLFFEPEEGEAGRPVVRW
ncbi:MAG: Nif3-like dinuclear metal center hexameric protein [Fimbriimonadales bacterium]|nr:Nif3-like dinuclear metal center hexameric protein [Fimbriimonadales bacterium]